MNVDCIKVQASAKAFSDANSEKMIARATFTGVVLLGSSYLLHEWRYYFAKLDKANALHDGISADTYTLYPDVNIMLVHYNNELSYANLFKNLILFNVWFCDIEINNKDMALLTKAMHIVNRNIYGFGRIINLRAEAPKLGRYR